MRNTTCVVLASLALSVLFRASNARAALVTVGSNAATCDFTSLAFAIVFSNSGVTPPASPTSW